LLVSGPVAQEKQGIWVISVIGATLKKLRDDAHDASLSHDGTKIVFRDAVNHGVWVMDADGGNAKEWMKHEAGMHIFFPTWLANDKRIAYARLWNANGEAKVVLESRNAQGTDPVIVLSNPRLSDQSWGQNGRLIYSLREPPPNQYDSNLWELRFDPETGKPKGNPRRLTDWTGFFFNNPELTTDGKRLVFLNHKAQSDVYVAELESSGNALKTPQRLTLDDRVDWPGGWSLDSKTMFFYSDLAGSIDIYKQGVADRNPEPIVTGSEEKCAPQISPDGKWLLYLQWPMTTENAQANSGKLMRIPIGGGPAETVMDVKGDSFVSYGDDPTNTAGSFPSFRCTSHAPGTCVVAEADDTQITFSSFDPVQGRKAELVKVPANKELTRWDLSPDGSRVALSVFDYKVADVQIVPLNGGAAQKFSVMPWTELVAVAWAADGKSLFLASYSSRGTSIVHTELTGASKPLFKSSWDIFALTASPDGHALAFGPVITSANAWTIPSFPAN
jgi:Tol biopolymer transport system component